MSIYNRRNAVVGFIALKMIKRRLSHRKRSARKAIVVGSIGLLSLGALVGVGAIVVKHKRGEAKHLEGYAVSDDAGEITGEHGAAGSEQIPATS